MSHLMSHPIPVHDPTSSVRALLRDGVEARIRPLSCGETAPVLAVFEAMSERSRALRYLTGMPRLPGAMLRMLADVDDDRHVAWVALVDDRPVGIARYLRLPDDPQAVELALEVVDAEHGRGLGTLLLDAVTTVAAARGVHRVHATMAADNTPSRRLIERVGGLATRSSGLAEADGPLRLLDPPVVDRAAVLAAASAGPDRMRPAG